MESDGKSDSSDPTPQSKEVKSQAEDADNEDSERKVDRDFKKRTKSSSKYYRERRSNSRERHSHKSHKRNERYGSHSRYSHKMERDRDRDRKPYKRYRRDSRSRSNSPRRSKHYHREDFNRERGERNDKNQAKAPAVNIYSKESSRLTQEIQKRKQLFSKKDAVETAPSTSSSVWKQTSFTGDSDGKMSAKFKRLMGMKGGEGTDELSDEPKSGGQDKYLADLEKQYEVARVITHTQRGLGLGFSNATKILNPNHK